MFHDFKVVHTVQEVLEQIHDSVVKPLNIRKNLLLQKKIKQMFSKY